MEKFVQTLNFETVYFLIAEIFSFFCFDIVNENLMLNILSKFGEYKININ